MVRIIIKRPPCQVYKYLFTCMSIRLKNKVVMECNSYLRSPGQERTQIPLLIPHGTHSVGLKEAINVPFGRKNLWNTLFIAKCISDRAGKGMICREGAGINMLVVHAAKFH
jgi:hypothetical protein